MIEHQKTITNPKLEFKSLLVNSDGGSLSNLYSISKLRERFLFNLSRENPLIYGLLSLAIAIIAGWVASSFFRYIRHT